MDSASSSRQSSKLSVADDKKRDKKHKKSSSSVDAKRETSSPNLNKELENKSDTAQTNSENVTDFLNDPSLQTGIKHNLVRSECPVEFVTIYSDRAEVTRKVAVDITTVGVQEIILNDLLPNVVENSVRVSGGEGDAVILEVSFDRRFETHESADSAAAKRRKELEQLKHQIETLQSELQRVQKEESWLVQFSTERIVTEEKDKADHVLNRTVIPLEDMMKMMSFYSQELTRVGQERLKLMNAIEDEEAKMKQLNDEIASGATNYGEEKREVIVVLYVRSVGPISLQISYVLTGAKWASSYDFRLSSNTGDKKETSCQLVYYGSVENDSGEDWKDVQLALSTATPSSAAKLPALKTLYATAQAPYRSRASGWGFGNLSPVGGRGLARKIDMNILQADIEDDEDAPVNITLPSTSVEQGATSQTYNIQRPVTMAADKKPRKVTIAVMDLSVQLHYTTVPSLAEKAYLRAKANNSSEYQLLPGPMNVFNDNVFVANSHLGATSPGEDFDVFLGADTNIKVDFKPVRRATNTSTSLFLSKTKHQLTTHVTLVKNLKAEKISLTIFDQLPLSEDDKIKVKLIDPEIIKDNEAVVLNDFNNIRWKFSLKPNEEKKIILQYNIEYPADRELDFYKNESSSIDSTLESV
jgi:uncharacterized protein (TIGR02231 family)